MKIELDYNEGDEVWIIGQNGKPCKATVTEIEVLVGIKEKGKRGRPCRTYKQSWAVGTTKEQIEELIEGRCG